jgi:epoxyqueuosine reductase
VCPYNHKFARELAEPAFAPREALAGKDARTLARELLGMTQDEFSAAFRGSPMKRAKLRGLKRNAAVVLGNVGTVEDVPALRQALDDSDPLVREHAGWALARIHGDGPELRPRLSAAPSDAELDVAPGEATSIPAPRSAT